MKSGTADLTARNKPAGDTRRCLHRMVGHHGRTENMKYRKKPVVIETVQWTGSNLKEIIAFTGLHESARKWTWAEYEAVVAKDGLKIFTLEGPLMATVGDWIIKGVKGELYPCKPDIFEATYEAVRE